jgi:serine/threonine protein kinase
MNPPNEPRKDALIGRTISGCKFLEKLGKGRTSNVYKVRYEGIEGIAAVKLLRGEEAKNPELRQAFLREARAIAALDHQNIVKIFDVIETKDAVLIVMEYLAGKNVWEVLQDDEDFGPERTAKIGVHVARALAAAHKHKLVHRDVKPQNMILVGRDRAKVVDFGLAALPGAGGGRVGTPHYMAPEQASRSRVDGAIDVYALGATLYHMLTGKTPYEGKTVGEILKAHKEGQLVAPRQVNAMVPAPLDKLIRQMMAPAKGYRPSATEVVETLEEILAEAEWRRRRSQTRRGGGGRRHPERPGDPADTEEMPRRYAGRKNSATGAIVGVVIVITALLAGVLVLVKMNKKDPAEGDGPGASSTSASGPVILTPDERDKIRRDTADRAMAAVVEWTNRNPAQMKEGIRRFREVASMYPNTSAARGAGKRAADLEMKLEASMKPPPPPKKVVKEPRVSSEELNSRYDEVRRLLARFQVDVADGKIKVLARDAEGSTLHEKVKIEGEALRWVVFVREQLASKIQASGGNIPYTKLKPGHPDDKAIIVAANTSNILMQSGEKEWMRPWTDLSPREILNLANHLVSGRDHKTSFALGVYLVRAGLKAEAQNMFQRAMMIQQTYEEMIERLGR